MFLNPLLLFGLIAVAVPPIIHLLNRRRYHTVEWAAMQFLEESPKTRRRLFIEDILLMLLRMLIIALLVAALASPQVRSSVLADLAGRDSRNVVLVFDASGSMGYTKDGESTYDKAKAWARDFLGTVRPGDGVAVVAAGALPAAPLEYLAEDAGSAREALEKLPPPGGEANLPEGVQYATEILDRGKLPRREVIVLTDGQFRGWADAASQDRWALLSRQAGSDETQPDRIWAVNVDPDRGRGVANFSLGPIRCGPATVTGRPIDFRVTVKARGAAAERPKALQLEIDGELAGTVPIPDLGGSRTDPTVRFERVFDGPGSHLVTLRLPDDALPGDNVSHFALEVLPSIPVLIVDAGSATDPAGRRSYFIESALSPEIDPSPVFRTRVVAPDEFGRRPLNEPVPGGGEPAVLILADMPGITRAQSAAVEEFLNEGGGVLVTLGPRAEAASYDGEAYAGGTGWLPARPVEPIGDEADLESAPRLAPPTFAHESLARVRRANKKALERVYFPRYWKLEVPAKGGSAQAAGLTNARPLMAVKKVGRGEAVVIGVPLDDSWATNLTYQEDYVPLTHELVYSLAGGRRDRFNRKPGQPIVFRAGADESPAPLRLADPAGEVTRVAELSGGKAVFPQTRAVGVYTVTTRGGRRVYYTVQPEGDESDLTPADDKAKKTVAGLFPDGTFRYAAEVEEIVSALDEPDERQEIWWLIMPLVIAFLVLEVVMTRRAANRAGV